MKNYLIPHILELTVVMTKILNAKRVIAASMALTGVVLALSFGSTSARAEWRGDDRGHRVWVHDRYDHRYYRPGYAYGPPVVYGPTYYAPPPVVYGPPALNVVIPLR
jgi:hypothetical protein